MNIYKLLGGVLLTAFLFIPAPYLAARYGLLAPLADKAVLILIVTTVGLVVKSVVGDVVAGEFLFHKFGYDNCVITFGAILTALSLQLVSSTDLFPGLSSVVFLRDIPTFSIDPVANRSAQLLVFLLVALAGTLVTGAVSAAIKKTVAKGPDFLSFLNSGIGLFLLGLYVLLLVTKGQMMLFLLLFMAGGLVIPLLIDIHKHGSDNIFRRSGRDLLNYEITKSTLRVLHVSAGRVNTAVAGGFSFASVVAFAFAATELVDVVRFLVSFFVK